MHRIIDGGECGNGIQILSEIIRSDNCDILRDPYSRLFQSPHNAIGPGIGSCEYGIKCSLFLQQFSHFQIPLFLIELIADAEQSRIRDNSRIFMGVTISIDPSGNIAIVFPSGFKQCDSASSGIQQIPDGVPDTGTHIGIDRIAGVKGSITPAENNFSILLQLRCPLPDDLLIPMNVKEISGDIRLQELLHGFFGWRNKIIQEKDFRAVREVQNKLLTAYENDLSKHAPAEMVTKIRMLWNSIPTQLAKENKKFVYGLVREGARAREYEVAITWLMDVGLVYKVERVKKPDFPLRAYQDFSAFKLFVLDVGLLGAMSRLNAKVILEGDRMFEEFKGALTEQYVLQQLIVHEENDIFYWSSEKGTGELDFLIQMDDKIVPIEVKAEENLQAKSLRSFVQKYDMEYAVRTSMSDYREQDWMVNYPLYDVGSLNEYMREK